MGLQIFSVVMMVDGNTRECWKPLWVLFARLPALWPQVTAIEPNVPVSAVVWCEHKLIESVA